MSDLTLIIPAKNEKESLPKVLDELGNFNFKKYVILEASDKLTIEAIKNYDCRIIYQESKGYGDALKKGIETVDTEFLCIFNADGSFNPKELGLMINKLKDDKYDIVFASRYEKNCGSDDDTLVTLIGNYIFTFLGKIFFKLEITDILYTFVMAKTTCIKKLEWKLLTQAARDQSAGNASCSLGPQGNAITAFIGKRVHFLSDDVGGFS